MIEKEYQEVFTSNNKGDEEEKESKENEDLDKIEKDEKTTDIKNKDEGDKEKKEETKETENEKCINNFRKDMPFKISIIPLNSNKKIPFVDNKYFTSLSKKLKEKFELNSINEQKISKMKKMEQ